MDEVQAGVIGIISQLTAMTGSKDFVVRLHSDNALEFVTQRFSDHINSQGIFKTKTVPHNPASNGRAARAVQSFETCSFGILHRGRLGAAILAVLHLGSRTVSTRRRTGK